MTKTRFIDLDELYSFVVDDISISNYLRSQNSVRSFHSLKFKISIVQIKSDWDMAKTKFIDLDEFYNFIVDDFSI